MKNKKTLNMVLGFGAICIMAFSSAFAYLSDNEFNYTNYIARRVTVDLIEGGMYNKDNGDDDQGGLEYGVSYPYTRGELFHGTYDIGVTPYAHNSGSVAAIVFMEVVVPLVDSDLIDDATVPVHNIGNETKIDAFSFTFGKSDNNEDFYYGNDLFDVDGYKSRYSAAEISEFDKSTLSWGYWIYMGSKYYESNGEVSCGYRYGYCTPIFETGKTLPLFDWVRVADFVTDEDGVNLELPIRLYAIQADAIKGSSTVIESGDIDTSEAKAVNTGWMNKEELQFILNTYINQDTISFYGYELNDANDFGRYDAGGADLY